MALWMRFEQAGQIGFGTLEGDVVAVHGGDMFDNPARRLRRAWRSSDGQAPDALPAQQDGRPVEQLSRPGREAGAEPARGAALFPQGQQQLPGPGETIRRPKSYSGRVVYEGELGIVIGRTCRAVAEEAAADHIFGYTCINDVTAAT